MPKDFNTLVPKIEYDKNGTMLQTVVSVPVSSLGNDIPSPEDYKLSKLLAAGVPLNPVSANVLDVSPTEAEASRFLDGLEKSSPDSDEPVQPSNE